jgi:hypothetical protein
MHFTGLVYSSNTTNTLEIRMHDTGGAAGLLYSVTDSATGVPYMVSNASTTFKKFNTNYINDLKIHIVKIQPLYASFHILVYHKMYIYMHQIRS